MIVRVTWVLILSTSPAVSYIHTKLTTENIPSTSFKFSALIPSLSPSLHMTQSNFFRNDASLNPLCLFCLPAEFLHHPKTSPLHLTFCQTHHRFNPYVLQYSANKTSPKPNLPCCSSCRRYGTFVKTLTLSGHEGKGEIPDPDVKHGIQV